jgi:hypothetical protein
LDVRILQIPRPLPANLNLGVGVYSAESNRETCKNESLADDNTVLTLINRDSLLAIKSNLEEFAVISGLHCNFDKTVIMPVHPPTDEELITLQESGLVVTNSIRLLGADISPDPVQVSKNFEKIKNKIAGLISYWSRFRLSLPGRISISKTFLVSQINYLGCIFKPTNIQMSTIQNMINCFIRKNIRISDERIYLSPAKGGLGFFNISEFLDAQRCTWLLKAKKQCIDNWRYDLNVLAPCNDPLLIRSCDINKNANPVLYNICLSYENFYGSFCEYENNYLHAQLFCNKLFKDTATGRRLNREFFGIDFYNNNKENIRRLRYSDCFTNNGFKTLQEFQEIGLQLTLAIWMRLRNAVTSFNKPPRSLANRIDNFVSRWKKGCRSIRSLMRHSIEDKISLSDIRPMNTFMNLAGTYDVNTSVLGPWISLWNISTFTSDF